MERALPLSIINKLLYILQEGNWVRGSQNVEELYFQENSDHRFGEGHHAVSSIFFPLPPADHRTMTRPQISLGVPTDPQDYLSQSWSLQQSLSE